MSIIKSKSKTNQEDCITIFRGAKSSRLSFSSMVNSLSKYGSWFRSIMGSLSLGGTGKLADGMEPSILRVCLLAPTDTSNIYNVVLP
ncbi:hypothetical protein DPMN_086996 [Dreissena polymorpha]|uniref:Uncharacterized protein n=1 Tax=Dreissena polymorpha TaxID=45954 RepID=A0A9D4KS62_DREPO|nr:hypothetical protein DPMN_086996 [Dreissena polymorpha]